MDIYGLGLRMHHRTLKCFIHTVVDHRAVKTLFIKMSRVFQKWKWADGMDLREEVSDWADNSSSTVPVDDDGGAFAVVMSQMFDWKWLPATQSVWNSWICQSSQLSFRFSPKSNQLLKL